MNTYLKVKDAANLLEVTSSALTKYYLLFEKHNYRFSRSIQGKLMFSNHDMELFGKLLQLKNAPNFTVEKAVVQLLEENVNTFNLARQIQNVKLEYAEVEQLIQKQTEIIEMQQEQQHRIEELYKLHKNSVREIEELIKQKELSGPSSIFFKSHKD